MADIARRKIATTTCPVTLVALNISTGGIRLASAARWIFYSFVLALAPLAISWLFLPAGASVDDAVSHGELAVLASAPRCDIDRDRVDTPRRAEDRRGHDDFESRCARYRTSDTRRGCRGRLAPKCRGRCRSVPLARCPLGPSGCGDELVSGMTAYSTIVYAALGVLTAGWVVTLAYGAAVGRRTRRGRDEQDSATENVGYTELVLPRIFISAPISASSPSEAAEAADVVRAASQALIAAGAEVVMPEIVTSTIEPPAAIFAAQQRLLSESDALIVLPSARS